jgi:hypothetical protein
MGRKRLWDDGEEMDARGRWGASFRDASLADSLPAGQECNVEL